MSFLNVQKECEDTNQDLLQYSTEQFRHRVSERVKLYEVNMKGSASPAYFSINKNNNIRHVVPVGVLIVLFTLYLTTTAIQSKYVNYVNPEDERNSDFGTTLKYKEMQAQEATKRIKILEKLLEYKDRCTELEVFTKDVRWVNEIIENESQLNEIDTECEQITEESVIMSAGGENGQNHDQKESKDEEKPTEIVQTQHTNRDESKISRQNEKSRPNKALEMKNNQINNKNDKNNHSTTNNDNNKKDESIAKKSNTAEPIIYVFALVFIYLLLKAASDINQHYKSVSLRMFYNIAQMLHRGVRNSIRHLFIFTFSSKTKVIKGYAVAPCNPTLRLINKIVELQKVHHIINRKRAINIIAYV